MSTPRMLSGSRVQFTDIFRMSNPEPTNGVNIGDGLR